MHVAQIENAEVGVLLTGAGPLHASRSVSRLFRADNDFGACISSGLAGALKPEFEIAQVLAARAVLTGDGSGNSARCSEALLAFADECGAIPAQRFYTAGRVIAKAAEKQHLGERADAVEMESFAVLQEAAAAGVPAVAIRAVSDLAGEDLPLDMTDVFTDDGQISMPRVMAQAARNPQAIPALVKLGQNSKKAAESLAKFLDRYITAIGKPAGNL